ncbi:thioredoxin-disulfide reductase [Candidatus Saccharibacteria bacterium]|nr:thioredoxin-disulfide reductase [Candidatus Saccharibacteria bacterium]
MYDVIIIGAGVAGMTAAIYARRAGKSVLVFETMVCGGQIVNTTRIENWPGDFGVSGTGLTKKIFKQMEELGAEIKYETVMDVEKYKDEGFVIKTEETEYLAKTVILAVGTEDRKMELKREEELLGRGISYCATCDGALFEGKAVAVVGGGNTAFYDALYLADIAAQVYVVHRRDKFRGDAALVKKVRAKENVEFVLGFVPEEILGKEKVSGLKLKPSGLVKGIEGPRELNVEGIFVAVGKKPATDKFKKLVELDENGYIVAGENCTTSCHGIFVAGDCRTKTLRQLVTAASDGAMAASEAVQYLSNVI